MQSSVSFAFGYTWKHCERWISTGNSNGWRWWWWGEGCNIFNITFSQDWSCSVPSLPAPEIQICWRENFKKKNSPLTFLQQMQSHPEWLADSSVFLSLEFSCNNNILHFIIILIYIHILIGNPYVLQKSQVGGARVSTWRRELVRQRRERRLVRWHLAKLEGLGEYWLGNVGESLTSGILVKMYRYLGMDTLLA